MSTTKSRSLAGVALGSATALAATALPTLAPAVAAPAAPARSAAAVTPAAARHSTTARTAYGTAKVAAPAQVVKKKRKRHRTSRPS